MIVTKLGWHAAKEPTKAVFGSFIDHIEKRYLVMCGQLAYILTGGSLEPEKGSKIWHFAHIDGVFDASDTDLNGGIMFHLLFCGLLYDELIIIRPMIDFLVLYLHVIRQDNSDIVDIVDVDFRRGSGLVWREMG